MPSKKVTCIMAILAIVVLILAPDAAFRGASSGIEICLKNVIPSLFPFFVFSSILSNAIQGTSVVWLEPIGKICGIPCGAESILLLGALGGYPVGAKCLTDAYATKIINKEDANRMLCFCNNVGPSFIFGMTSSLFLSRLIPWLLWCIQLISVILLAYLLPNKSTANCKPSYTTKKNTIEQSVKAMAVVCSWIVLMRVVLGLIQMLPIDNFPKVYSLVITGILELSNGCIELNNLENVISRYILIGQFLSLGGICVILQTKSLIRDLDIRCYILGKLLQTLLVSGLLYLSVPIVFPGNYRIMECIIYIVLSAVALLFVRHKAKIVLEIT